MPIPPSLAAKIIKLTVKTAATASKGAKIVRKEDIAKIGGYVVKIVRRNTLGADSGISQIVTVSKNNVKEAIWHIVVRAGKVIHKHLE